MKKTIKTTIFALAAIILFSGMFMTNNVETQAAAKTTTKTTTKKNTKVVKLKKAVKSKTSKKVSTKKQTKKYNESDYKVTENITIKTTKVTKCAAKKKTITTTVKTTVKTTKEDNASDLNNATGHLEDNSSNGNSFNVRSLNGLADPMVIKAFEKLNYKIVIDGSVSYAGKFDARNQQVTLRSANKDYFLHELGHFVSFITGLKDSTPEFVNIYNKEAGRYSGSNASYVTKNNKEYFAESYRDFSANPSGLKSTRPATYNYIKSCVDSINDNTISYINSAYYGA